MLKLHRHLTSVAPELAWAACLALVACSSTASKNSSSTKVRLPDPSMLPLGRQLARVSSISSQSLL